MGKDYKKLFFAFWETIVLKDIPDAKIAYKDKSKLMKLLGVLSWVFNRGFMTDFTTVLGNTIYFPTQKWLEANYQTGLRVLTHEYIHLWDKKQAKAKWKIDVHSLSYVFPQVLVAFSLLAFLAFFSSWFLLSLLFLLCAIPWPSPGRVDIETNGYATNMLFRSVTIGPMYNAKADADVYSEFFVSSEYYFMSWNRSSVVKTLLKKYETLPTTHEGMKNVYQWLRTQLS
jgi:hypothetical protein